MRIFKKFILILLILLVSACGSVRNHVAYTIYPIGYILQRVGGNRINTVSIQTEELVQVSQIAANYIESLNDSIALFHIGELEPYIDLYYDEIKDTEVDVHDLSVLNALYKYKKYTPVNIDSNITFVESEYYESDLFKDIDTYDYDPFIWLSPIGMYSMAKDVYTYLASNYVEQASYFEQNYEALADDLITLDANYQALATRLAKENKSIKFVSMSGSFGTWQKDYGIQVYPVCLSKYGALPSDAELDIIKNSIVANEVKYIAYEPNLSEDMKELLNLLEVELDLKRVTLNNISSLTKSQIESGKDYLTLMYENLSILENMASDNGEQ
jgi:ABC-type metal ion transport system, periplasmic component/surface adhesin